jgi:hypothetical protein
MSAVSVLNVLCRGIVGHVSYLAACSLSEVYSEYLLYEPIARIAQSKGYRVRCEVPVEPHAGGKGDSKRIDFELSKKDGARIALEVKWCRNRTCDVSKDVKKLRRRKELKGSPAYLLVFGSGKVIENLKLKSNGKELKSGGKWVHWDAKKTHYAARWYHA